MNELQARLRVEQIQRMLARHYPDLLWVVKRDVDAVDEPILAVSVTTQDGQQHATHGIPWKAVEQQAELDDLVEEIAFIARHNLGM